MLRSLRSFLALAVAAALAACPATTSTPIAGPGPIAPGPGPGPTPPPAPVDAAVDAATVTAAKAALRQAHPDDGTRIDRGVDQVASLWRASDGDLVAFVTSQFAASPVEQDALFARLEAQFEQLDGLTTELGRSLRWHADVDTGPMLPVDELLAAVDPGAHLTDDLFATKVGFVALLNFPLTTLAQRLAQADGYTRRQWAEVRLASRFDRRIPGDVAAAASAAEAVADAYIAGYNLWMHHVLAEDGQRHFPAGKRLISHWNLRDELKANYADADALAKQRTIVAVMERIVTQTIPAAVIDNPRLDWNPFTNQVTVAPAAEIEADAPAGRPAVASNTPEADVRFQKVIDHLTAAKAVDRFAPTAPSHLARAFAAAEMPEDRVRALIVSILASPNVALAAAEIQRRLGRPLGPQDLWYEFGGGEVAEATLDAETRKRYPTPAAFKAALPGILTQLGWAPDRAKVIAAHIAVDPSRGAGHAMEARWREDLPHLRTRVEKTGMDYKGYNIAVHELGHNVEQYLSLYEIDHTLLAGVPNTAFTEALAFLFQARDLQLLGKPAPDAAAQRSRVLDHFWNTWEIAGSALVEIDVWHWLYEHPDATAAELRDATGRIARATWDQYYAPVLGGRGETSLLGIYSHTISSPLYLFNYVLGHLIAFQLEEHVAGKDAKTFAAEFTRVARQGAILPDSWMRGATGQPVSSQPMLDATARALAGK
ncbi:MAG: hypothetical protein R3B06_08905 [Kofleriaceae bacterium]